MRITINEKSNPKMLENFNQEEYPDITIILESSKVSLVLAYLSIDSQFFGNLDPQTEQVDLSTFPEKLVIQVLRSLYGDGLMAESISELEGYYSIINQLQIEEYRTKIQEQILINKELMENLEILEFCFKNNLICQQIKNYHFQTNLKCLEDNRKFLQLNKISLETLVPILLEYHRKMGENGNTTINNILENYFNRNNIRPADFFEEYDFEFLQVIWEQFHHSLQITEKRVNKFKSSQSIINENKTIGLGKNKSNSLKEEKEILEMKENRIQELLAEISDKDNEIARLRDRLYEIKKISFPPTKNARRLQSIPIIPIEDEQISILEGVKNSRSNQKSVSDSDNSLAQLAFREQRKQISQHQKAHRF